MITFKFKVEFSSVDSCEVEVQDIDVECAYAYMYEEYPDAAVIELIDIVTNEKI